MSCGEMVMRLFHARTAAHVAHFQTRSYAEHKALNEFYDEIVDATDDFAETYQGIFGLIPEFPAMALPTGKPCDWIEALRQWLKQNREACCKGETTLENLHDVITQICGQTCYKLRFLDSGMGASEPDADDMAYMGMKKW
jgi:hypothetical protein